MATSNVNYNPERSPAIIYCYNIVHLHTYACGGWKREAQAIVRARIWAWPRTDAHASNQMGKNLALGSGSR